VTGISLRRPKAAHRGPYVLKAVAALRLWPALTLNDARQGAFAVRGTEIVRLAGRDEVRIRLTAPAIDRLEPQLGACDQVRTCSDRTWVVVQVAAEPDLELLFALTSVAIKANAQE
jgi:hypothetical protein